MSVQTNFRAVDMPGTTKPASAASVVAAPKAATKAPKAAAPKVEEPVVEVVAAVEEEKTAE
jgi:hypothetical protein